jgi:DNA polymerase III alpha subunit (gram-positive type)
MKIKNLNQYEYSISSYKLLNLKENKYLILDLESTGLDTEKDEVTEIAFLPIANKMKIFSNPKSILVKPRVRIPERIENLTGIKNANLRNARNFKNVLKSIAHIYREYVWVAQCGFEFDFPLLMNQYKMFFAKKLNVKTLDIKLFYLYLHPRTKLTVSTDFLINKYKIMDSGIRRHRAGGDVKIISGIFLNLLREYEEKKINKIDLQAPLLIKKFVPK